jgi:ATP-dependent DNA helicase RecG
MTATPIPRTLGLTAFGDLDLTLIKEKPANRLPVITKLVSLDKINSLGKVLNRHLAMDEQIYIVVPLINVSDSFNFIDINQAYNIFTEMLPDARINILHGKMKSADKEQIMNDFKNHKTDVLISTTVIEVGVDVKNASNMVILNAERYGLSQIHQLRGRVGRGNIQSYCYLVTDKSETERLQILEKTNDGFELSEEDFRLRGPGDFLGEEQSGFSSLNFDFESKDLTIWKCAISDSKEYVLLVLGGLEKNDRVLSMLKNVINKNSNLN